LPQGTDTPQGDINRLLAFSLFAGVRDIKSTVYLKRYRLMRCPKCGFISFDHLEECLKCNKNIKAVSDSLYGSTYNVKPPTFLRLEPEQRREQVERMDISAEQSFNDDQEYVDEELEFLVEEEEDETEGEIIFKDEELANIESSVEAEKGNDEEIEIDFSQFEDADEPEVALFDEDEDEDEDEVEEEAHLEPVEEQTLTIDMPAELSDISDLAPPAKASEETEQPVKDPVNSDFSDLNLDDLNFDLNLDGDLADKKGVPEEAVLSLDELDFSETLKESSSNTSSTTGNTDMDEDLDFDLDLGGLSIHGEVK
jgi:hypothetical protein